MNLQSYIVRVLIIALPLFILHYLFAMSGDQPAMTNEEQGRVFGSLLFSHIFSVFITWAVCKKGLKSNAWTKLGGVYIVILILVVVVAGLG